MRSNRTWSMDFMSDALDSGRKVRLLNIIDDFHREALWIDPAFSYPAEHVVRALKILASERGLPEMIRVDNGPEFIPNHLNDYCEANSIELHFIQPGKPMQHGYIEPFNRFVREEVLDAYLFESLGHMRILCDRFKEDHNANHPHQSLCGQSPLRFKYLYDQEMIYYDPVKTKMHPAVAGALTRSPKIMTGRLQDIRSKIIT